jgi:hypothetical protein
LNHQQRAMELRDFQLSKWFRRVRYSITFDFVFLY